MFCGESVAMAHRGFGKLILFGEHFVVYKVPALVAAVADYTECEVKLLSGGKGISGEDNRLAVPGYKVEKKDEHDEAVKLVLKHLDCDYESQGVEVASAGQKLLDTAAAQSRGQRSDLRGKVRRKGKQRGVGESHRFCVLGRLYSQEFHGVRGGFEGA